MKTIIIKNSWLNMMSHGWGNGYVLIPEGHSLHGKGYDEINEFINVHGGLTFAELVTDEMIEEWDSGSLSDEDKGCWMVGFDTAHYADTIENWPRKRVVEETEDLKTQIEKLQKLIT